MHKNRLKILSFPRRLPRAPRLIAESLEGRRLLSVTTELTVAPIPSVTLLPVSADVAHVTVAADGALWYTTAATLHRVSPTGQNTPFTVPTQPDGTPRPIVSNVVFSLNSTWFAIADAGATRIEQMTPDGTLHDTATTAPHIQNLTLQQDTLWFTQGDNTLGKLSPDGISSFIIIPQAAHLSALAADTNGDIWFTGQSSSDTGLIGNITPDGLVHTSQIDGSPTGIATGPDGTVVVTDTDALWRIDAAGALTKIPLPDIAPTSPTLAPDGTLWFIDAHQPSHAISRLTSDGAVAQFSTGVQAVPNSLALAPDGSVYFTVSAPSAGWLGKLSPSLSTFGMTNSFQMSDLSGAAVNTVTTLLSSIVRILPFPLHTTGPAFNASLADSDPDGTSQTAHPTPAPAADQDHPAAPVHEDPATFQGEFGIAPAALPPSSTDRVPTGGSYESHADTIHPPTIARAPDPANTLSPSNPLPPESRNAAPAQPSLEDISAATPIVLASLQFNSAPALSPNPPAPSTTNSVLLAAPPSATTNLTTPQLTQENIDTQPTLANAFAHWWRFTACLSIAPSLQMRRRSPLRKIYW